MVGRAPDGDLHVVKLLSNARAGADAAVEGVRRLLHAHAGAPADWRIDEVRIATTVATNALLERKGEPTLLAITRGHADALAIGRQSRPALFDLHIRKPSPVHAEVVEIDERVTSEGAILRPLDVDQARSVLTAAHAHGLRAVAVALMHGHRHTAHEAKVACIAREVGFTQVSTSFETSALIKLGPRAETTVVDAFLSPGLALHIDRVRGELAGLPGAERARLLFMQSSGALVEAPRFRGKDAVLSGPAGGVVALAAVAAEAGLERVIGFDMGGTSTDVSRWAGEFERSFESEVAGVRLRAPMMSLETVAAGGGSICRVERGRLRVGPGSAGSDPGPAAYRRGGPLTVTDCNFVLGKLQTDHFPAVFGDDGDQPPDLAAAQACVEAQCAALAATGALRPTAPALAEAFIAVAIENMARAIRRISVQRGYDPRTYALVAFGGAAGQHACLVAEALGVAKVVVHPLAGVLSAYGLGRAERAELRECSVEAPLDSALEPVLARLRSGLERQARAALGLDDAGPEAVVETRLLVRYAGTDSALTIASGSTAEVRANFDTAHRQSFGFATPERPLVVQTLTVEVRRPAPARQAVPRWTRARAAIDAPRSTQRQVRMAGRTRPTAVHDRATLAPGCVIEGPALIREDTGLVALEPGWSARLESCGHLVLQRTPTLAAAATQAQGPHGDPRDLELFHSRFTAVAEEMGEALRNTAISVNIKERLDFSCALFDASGALVANAPHIPVHLGSMGDSVRAVMRVRRADGRGFVAGDVYALNAPYAGGTHLPDITVVAPVFEPGARRPFAFVAARGHHADVGGLTPGSMPPQSRTVEDEGVLIENLLLVEGDGSGDGRLREPQAREVLASGPNPARDIETNIADLKAQIAACVRGGGQLSGLVRAYGLDRVRRYMGLVQDNAEAAVRHAVRGLIGGRFTVELDGGAVIVVEVRIDAEAGAAVIDFTGTSAQLTDNFNAPSAIVRAAVMYVFRTIVAGEIPLNDGVLRPIEIIIPKGSMLAPQYPAAVAAGNVETSQVVVDALYGALGILAASQGTMNNLTFGDARRQYYETICGGAGAGPDFDGADAVQTHMTNSRLTDPEVLEARFPVLVDRFAIRRGSGGAGAHRGGEGVVRRLVFREPMTVSMLANRRRVAPFGLAGGEPGALGVTRIERADGRVETLGSTATRELGVGDAIVIETPGGGGFGRRSQGASAVENDVGQAADQPLSTHRNT